MELVRVTVFWKTLIVWEVCGLGIDWSKRTEIEECSKFWLKKIGKEHACPFTEMSKIATGADLGMRVGAGGATMESDKAFNCPLDVGFWVGRWYVCI